MLHLSTAEDGNIGYLACFTDVIVGTKGGQEGLQQVRFTALLQGLKFSKMHDNVNLLTVRH